MLIFRRWSKYIKNAKFFTESDGAIGIFWKRWYHAVIQFLLIWRFCRKLEYRRYRRIEEKNWRAHHTNDMFNPFCIIRSRKPCKTQRTGFPLFLPFSKLSETPVRSYLRILQGISTHNEFLWFVQFLLFLKSSETPVQSYLRIFQGISTPNEFLRFVPLLPFSKSSEMPVRPYLCTIQGISTQMGKVFLRFVI